LSEGFLHVINSGMKANASLVYHSEQSCVTGCDQTLPKTDLCVRLLAGYLSASISLIVLRKEGGYFKTWLPRSDCYSTRLTWLLLVPPNIKPPDTWLLLVTPRVEADRQTIDSSFIISHLAIADSRLIYQTIDPPGCCWLLLTHD